MYRRIKLRRKVICRHTRQNSVFAERYDAGNTVLSKTVCMGRNNWEDLFENLIDDKQIHFLQCVRAGL